ncbi:bifunctional RNase H/acid phosphatase [Streptomyces sp. NRRL S-340]|uniref:bifunctional RNase H/acid phosphatase n=1 Tax=Streptomyces sp. NRRL S-340 TaxID=1463901 RepID=UPI00055C7A22|nr:bifunctional RNase H/acid phosphatase [Streptomyces sp. NRRL S-340]
MREFVVEADGGSRGNPGPAGYGAVVLDAATGQVLAETAEYLGTATNNVAEYRGLLAGLRAAHALDPAATVHVRMDSKLVVEQMSGRWQIKHPDLRPLATEAARVFPAGRVGYEWIPRERNKHADRLANEAMDAGARGEQWSPPASPSTAEPDAGAPGTEAPTATGNAPTTHPSATAGAAVAHGAEAPGTPTGPAGSATAPSGTAPSGPTSSGPTSSGAAADPRAAAAGGAQSRTVAHAAQPPAAADAQTTAGAAAKAAADVRAARAVAGAGAARPVAAPGWAPADLGAPATLVLLRHGETPLTPQKRFSGSGGSDPSLSAIGREQAEKAAVALARRGTVQAVVSSPLARTRETAAIVAARLGLPVTVDDGLRETDFGAWEGLTFGEVRERHPEDLNAWLASPDAEPTGGGESFATTAVRIAAARDRLVAAHAGRTVLVVTHVTPIKTFVRLALGAPPESLFRMELSAASLSAVAYYADGNASVRLFNDTSHLR